MSYICISPLLLPEYEALDDSGTQGNQRLQKHSPKAKCLNPFERNMDVLLQTRTLMYVVLPVAAKLGALLFPSIIDQTGNSNLYLQKTSIIHWVVFCLFVCFLGGVGEQMDGQSLYIQLPTYACTNTWSLSTSITHPCSSAATIVTDNKYCI